MRRIVGLLLPALLLGHGLPASPQGETPDAAATAAVAGSTAAAPSPAVAGLRQDLENVVRSPAWRGDQWSVLVVSLDRGDTLFAHNAHVPLAPASNMKLFTTAAALYYLGPDFRYTTFLMATGPIENGVLRGDVVLYGTGDPTLSGRFHDSKTAVWEAFADTLAALGVREVSGDLVGDGSYFGGTGVGKGWKPDYMNASYAAPAGALSFNNNLVTLRIRPGEQAGWRPVVEPTPGGDGIAVVNQAETVGRGGTRIVVDRVAYDGPILVRGRIQRGGSGVWRAVPVPDPARYTAAVLRDVLEERGIHVRGELRTAATPAESPITGRSAFAPAFEQDRQPLRVLAVHRSPPLQEILEIINQESHNFYAEQVLRTVGRVALGEGTVEAAERAIRHLLQEEAGVRTDGLEIYDGSGLSPLNRASAADIAALLAYMAEARAWDAYWQTLPEAGQRHLRRMGGTPAGGNLRAKTGTIENVSALSGYVRTAAGERLAFSIIGNEVPSTWRAKRIEDAIGVRLAGFDRPVGEPAAPPPASTPEPARAEAAAPPEPRPAARPSERSYTIRRGDTLEGIAKRHGVKLADLRAANPGLNPRRLMPGKTVRIPGGG